MKRAIGLLVTTLVLRKKSVVFVLRSPPSAAGHIHVPERVLTRDLQHPDHIAYAPAGVWFANGTSLPTYDLLLHRH